MYDAASRPPLPPSDEPDVEPDERPSDDPESDEWVEPPSLGEDDPCCEVGEFVGIDDPDRQASSPAVAWSGEEWGTSWFDGRVIFRRLDEQARPTSELVVVPSSLGATSQMAHGNHRFALARSGDGSGGVSVVTRDGALVDDISLPAAMQGRAIARFPLAHGWAVVGTTIDEVVSSGTLFIYDDALRTLARHELGPITAGGFGFDPAVTAAKSVLVAATADPERGTVLRTYGGRSLELQDERLAGDVGTELAAVTFRDSVVVVGRTYEGSIRARVWDPFARGFLSEVVPLGRADGDQGLGGAADDRGGTLGICYPARIAEGTGNPDTLMFMLLGPTGEPVGSPVALGGYEYVAACAVAAAGQDRYAVLFWDAARSTRRPSIRAGLVRVRR